MQPPRKDLQSSSILLHAILLCLLFTTSTPIIVQDETSTEEGALHIPSFSNLCAALFVDFHYVCNPDPLALYQKYGYTTLPEDGKVDLGVKQRIDGNDAEIAGIKRVLQLMNQYILEEVLSISDYWIVLSKW